jgi:hypothetical protein
MRRVLERKYPAPEPAPEKRREPRRRRRVVSLPTRPGGPADVLLSYGPDALDIFRRAAEYVDRILRGTKPGDLPVQFPTKYEMAVNLKTAKALGLEVPIMLLARADEVIEQNGGSSLRGWAVPWPGRALAPVGSGISGGSERSWYM